VQKKNRIVYTIILFLVIAGLLGIILVFLPDQQSSVAQIDEPTETTETVVDTDKPPVSKEIPSEGHDYTSTVKDKPADTVAVTTGKPQKLGGKIYVVIDDVGNNLSDLEYFLKIKVPVTFAVMPDRTYSGQAVKILREAGFDVILHQPMEPVGNQDPGAGAIKSGMSKEQIYKVLEKNLESFPEISGINNHMGSKVTADKEAMTSVLSYLKAKGMFFLDSVTTDKSVAADIAKELGVPYAKRNAVFLDNENDESSITKAFLSGTQVASASGAAVMIGHVKSHLLVDVINDLTGELQDTGYTFHGLYQMFEGSGAL